MNSCTGWGSRFFCGWLHRIIAVGVVDLIGALGAPLFGADSSAAGPFDFAVYATGAVCGAVTISGNAYTDSFDSSQGAYSQTKQLSKGHIGVTGNATLNGAVAVNGAIFALNPTVGQCRNGSPGISLSGKAGATAGYLQLAAAPLYATPPPVTAGSQDLSFTSDTTLPPGNYGNLTVIGHKTLTLSPGSYNINSLTLTGNSVLAMSPSGPVVINVAGTNVSQAIDLTGGSLSNPSGIPRNLELIYGGTLPVAVSGGASSHAILYAPNAPVSLHGGSDWFGALVVGTLDDSGGVAIHYDRSLAVPPTIKGAAVPVPNAAGWNNSNVTVSFTCSDPVFGIVFCTPPVQVTTEGANQVVTGTAVNQAGFSASTSVTLNIDKTLPLISAATAPSPNAAGWNNANVTVTFNCADATSGVDGCPVSVVVSTEGAGQVASGTVKDKAGNSATASATVNLDKTPPVLSISSPADGATVNPGSLTVTGIATDLLSGTASVTCQGVAAALSGSTFSCVVPVLAGPNTITVQAWDKAGNTVQVIRLVQGGIPIILSVNPSTGQQGQPNQSVAITGQFTHFVEGTTQASFGAGITVASLTVSSGTTATAVLNIDALAATGPRTVTITTVSETATLVDGFTVIACTPAITQVVPSSGQQGQQNLPVAISGQCTHFTQGQTNVSVVVPGTADPWLAGLPTGATASCSDGTCDTVPAQAPVQVVGLPLQPGGILTFSSNGIAGYCPVASCQSGPDGIAGFPSAHGAGAQNGISDINTAPTNALIGVFLGPDPPDGSAAPAPSSSSTTAPLLKQIFFIGSARSITIPTGATRLYLGIMDGFGWWNNSGAYSVAIQANTGTQANFGAGITVASLEVNSATNATAVLNIDPAAATGTRSVTLTTNNEAVALASGFTVNPAVLSSGRIVAGHDVNTLSSSLAGPNESQFAVNIATWLTGATSGKILAVESSPGDSTRDYSPVVKSALSNAGFAVTYVSNSSTVSALTLSDVQQYGAIFVGETFPTRASISPSVLTQYVKGGGNVYVYGGVGQEPAVEAAFFNPFLQVFGLAFDTASYNGLFSPILVTSTHPIFNGITGKTLGSGIGQDIYDLGTNPNASIVQFQGQHGVYAVVDNYPGVSPTITMVSPNAGQQGQQNLSVAVTGQSCHFTQGSTTVSFGLGITVNALTVTDSNHLTVQITVSVTAATGPRTVTVGTGSEVITAPDGFNVLGNLPPTFTSLPATNWNWSSVASTGATPSARALGGGNPQVYDEVNDRLIVFGGYQYNLLNEIWVLANATGRAGPPVWTQLSPNGPLPAPMWDDFQAYDAVTNRLIIQGGSSDSLHEWTNDQTWVLANANGLGGVPSWTQLPSTPQPRGRHAGFYDPATNRLVEFAGIGPSGDLNDVWVLSNANGYGAAAWSQVIPGGTAPLPRESPSANYDPTTNRMIVFGGLKRTGFAPPYSNLNDVWVLTNANGSGGAAQWIQLNPTGTPPIGRMAHVAVYDSTTNQLLVFGGVFQNDSPTLLLTLNDVWLLRNANGLGGQPAWVQLQPDGAIPAPRFDAVAGFSASNGSMVATMGRFDVGGSSTFLNDIWLLRPNVAPAVEGQVFSYDADALDPEAGAVTYSLQAAPSGMSINSSTGMVQWTPQPTQLGFNTVTIRATDPLGLSSQQTLTIFVQSASIPRLLSVTPGFAQPGQQNLTVALTGQFTHFAQTATEVSFGPGIAVTGVAVINPTQLTAQITIANDANPGLRTVVAATGSEVITLSSTFNVQQPSVTPLITLVSPNSGSQGGSGPVTIVGQNTHFAQGSTQVDFGADITVSGITVTCSTCLSVTLAVAATAATGPRTVTVTTGTEVVQLAAGFTVTATPPLLTSMVPASGHQGQAVSSTITGLYTHWVQGQTQVDLGTGVTVNSVTVQNATSLTVQLTVDVNATPGIRNLTVTSGSEVVSASNVFTVNAGIPVIQSLAPVMGQLGQTLPVTITGQFTHFVQGTSQVSFGSGITVNSATVASSTTLTAQISIAPGAALGVRTVTVTTGTEVASLNNGFSVEAGTPVILSLGPNTGSQGQQNLSVTIAAQYTNFVQGTTSVNFGAGVATTAVAVTDSTHLTALISIAPDAAVGARTVLITTGSEIESLPNGFTVQQGVPTVLSVNPNTGPQGQNNLSVVITGQFTHFAQATSAVSFGAGITVNSLTVTDATHASAVISIASSAALGNRTITVTTGSEVVSLSNGFAVGAGTPTLVTLSPISATQGQQNISVTINGQFTNFVQGTTQVSFGGGGVTVNSVTVASATSLTATISLALGAATGARTVTVTTGTEVVSLASSFTVQQATNQAPVITIAPAWSVTLPNRLTITYTVTDDGLPLGGALTVSWETISGPGNVGFQNQTPSSISVGFDQAGTYVLKISATDTQFTVTQNVTVTVTGATGPPPTVSITSPADGAQVTTQINVTGSVTSANLASWTLEFRMQEESVFRPLATGTTPVTSGVLGVFDPTLLLNGTALIQLRASDTAGQTAIAGPIAVAVTKNQKIGNFTVSFNDLTVPVAGLPIRVIRTYDSRNKLAGDFGVGWTLDLKTVRLDESTVAGDKWNATTTGGAFPTYCIQPAKAHMVTVTLADGTNFTFDLTLTPQCQQLVPPDQVAIGFSARPGSTASLAVLGGNLALVQASFPGTAQLYDLNTGQLFDANRYRLTLPDGRMLDINQTTGGLEKMTDLNGNSLTVSAAGIIHSSGKSVSFTRDLTGRIAQITDPAGHILVYSYSAGTNDLVSVKDPENNTTTFGYDSNHGLLTIQDPRGIQPIRNTYDNGGRLISHTDAFGKVITYTHNLNTRQEVVTDRLGNVTVNEYDADGNIVKVTDALGGVTTRTYDAHDNLLTETNALGKTRTYTYDGQDNRLTETDPLGRTTTYTYNGRKQVLTVTDALNRVTTNTYDTNGNLLTTKDALNNVTTYTYNAQGLRTSVTDPLGGVTSYQYDAAGNLTQQADALGHVTTYTYDANGNRLSETRTRTTASGPETLVTSYQYNGLNRLKQTTYPDGSTTQIQYNAIGKQSVTIDPLGRQTSYQYDLMGRLTQTTYPNGTNEFASHDFEGNRVTSTDRASRITTYTYDALKRLTKTMYPDNTSTSTGYDAAGQVVSVTDARGNITQYQYDDAGRRTKVIDALNHSTRFAYDQVSNQASMTDANGNLTQYQYDANNRRLKVIYPDTTSDTTTYDALGRTTSKTDQAGKVAQFQYDLLGRLTQVTDALNQITKYTYDELGNRTAQTDANNHTTSFAYNKVGRRTKRTLPLGMAETSTYDAAGNLKTKTDFNGKTTTYNYDAVNRLTSKIPDPSFAAPTVSFSYTATGQRQSMADASGPTGYVYDLRDRLTQKTAPQGTLTYTYDQAGNLVSIRSSNTGGTSVDYTYDALNRLASVRDNRLASGTTTYAYDNAGNLQGYLYPNGVQSTYTYNALNRLTNLTVAKGSTLASYGYTLGPAGNRTQVTELGGRVVGYTYDNLYRLTQETIAGASVNGAIGYQYDPAGNRLQRTSTVGPVPASSYTYDANDRLTTDTYDANGNTTTSAANTYAYDFENHLKSQNGTAVTITYDGDGNRVAKTASGTTTSYLVDDRNLTGYAQVLEEVAGAAQRVYTYGLNRISQSQASGTSFYGYDGHGSVRLLTDATGAVTDRYDYDAFGNIISQAGSTPNVYLYSGEQNDANLGFYYLRARYLNPSTGRFVTNDPSPGSSSDPKSLHRYLYANADPINRHDPSGMLSLVEVSVTLTINSILSLYQDKLLFPILFQSIQCAECVIAPANQLYNIAVNALADGAGTWAQNLLWQAQAQQVQGYQALRGIIAQNYANFFSSLVTDTFSIKWAFELPYLNILRDEIFSAFPGVAAAAAAGQVVNKGTTYINKAVEFVKGVAEAYRYWSTNRSGCGKAMLFNALGTEIIQHTPDFGSVSLTEHYSFSLDGMTDDQYRAYVRGILQQIEGQ